MRVFFFTISPSDPVPADNTPQRSSLVAEANVVELLREEADEELGLRIVGGKDTPLGNIVIQEIVRDSIAARDGRLAPGDHILEVRKHAEVTEAAETINNVPFPKCDGGGRRVVLARRAGRRSVCFHVNTPSLMAA